MAKTKCPKCKGKGCSHCGGTGYHNNMNQGGMMKMYKGGYCGASNPAERPVKMAHGGMAHKKK